MGALEAVSSILAAAGMGVLGQSLFMSVMPDDPDVMIGVYEYAGEPPVETMGGGPPALSRPRIQVVCRATRDDYPAARDRAVAARDVLGAVTDVAVDGLRVLRVSPMSSVFPLGLDDKGRPRLAANFEVTL